LLHIVLPNDTAEITNCTVDAGASSYCAKFGIKVAKLRKAYEFSTQSK